MGNKIGKAFKNLGKKINKEVIQPTANITRDLGQQIRQEVIQPAATITRDLGEQINKDLIKPAASFFSNGFDDSQKLKDEIKNLNDIINKKNSDINSWNSRFNDTTNKLNYYTDLYGKTNNKLNRVRTSLNSANIVVGKYNILFPQYLDLTKQYDVMNNLYNDNLIITKNGNNALNSYENALDISIDLQKDKSKQLQEKLAVIENFGDLTTFQQVRNENEKLNEQIRISSDIYSTDNQLVNFQLHDLEYMTYINFYLFWLYYLLVFIIIIYLYFKSDISRWYRIAIILAFGIYPLIIKPIEKMVYFVMIYIYSLLSGNSFLNMSNYL